MVFLEQLQSLFQNWELAARGQGDAGAEAFAAVAAASAQRNGADTVVQELVQESSLLMPG